MGSKHEHVGYHIITPDGRRVSLYHLGDNPFENKRLSPFEGRGVEVVGNFDSKKRDLFVVEEVRQIG